MSSDAMRNRMLAVITVILVIAGLRASYAVTMPLAAAVVVVAAIWPIKPWLDRALPSQLSYLGTILVLVLISVGFIGAVYFSTAQVVRAFAQNQEKFNQIYGSAMDWAARFGFQEFGGQEGYTRLIDFGQVLLSNVYTVLVYLGFIALLVIFGLPEVPALRSKLHGALNAADRRQVIDTVDEIAEKVRQYLGVTALTSVLTGVASALWAFAVGLELALVWGVLNFLLNFIPIIGNIIGIIPPSVYAVIQFQNVTMPLVVLVGFVVLQIAISNFVYPMLQGRSLSLSPVAIIVALTFWGWIWGVAGALIAIPLTAAIVIVCQHFRSTEWIVRLLLRPKE
ncbi:MAG: AI-2E family transporter [Xanthobacteraceae bacterium]